MGTFKNRWRKLAASKKYRESFVVAQAKQAIPFQIRALMKAQGLSQQKLADQAGLTQGVISRAADPSYGNLALNTCFRIAAGFDVAFVGRFVPFSELDRWLDHLHDESAAVLDFETENEHADELLSRFDDDEDQSAVASAAAKYIERQIDEFQGRQESRPEQSRPLMDLLSNAQAVQLALPPVELRQQRHDPTSFPQNLDVASQQQTREAISSDENKIRELSRGNPPRKIRNSMADPNESKTEQPANVEAKPQTRFERLPSFGALYTNNVQFEHNAFDLKMIFGQFDGSHLVKQHFSVNMAWAEAKAVASLLLVNIAFYESINGRIQMPAGMKPDPPKFDGVEENPKLHKMQDRIARIQAVIFGED